MHCGILDTSPCHSSRSIPYSEVAMTTRNGQTTRRAFLGAAGAAALPIIVPRIVLGDDKKDAANDRLGLGFIGMGTMNRGHLGHFLGQKEVQVLAVCDVDTTRREAAKKTVNDRYGEDVKAGRFKGCDAYVDFRELLA